MSSAMLAPKSLAMPSPTMPPGGSYWSATLSSVPSLVGVKLTDPAVATADSGSDRQPMSSPGLSVMISASHSTAWPPNSCATQWERFP